MRRIIAVCLTAICLLANIGCIIVLTDRDIPWPRHVVEIDGELYIVDDETDRLRPLDRETDPSSEQSVPDQAEDPGS